jgi:hypothetical protein
MDSTNKVIANNEFFGVIKEQDSKYLKILKSNNALIDMLNKTIDNNRKELEINRHLVNELEKELEEYRTTASCCINRRQFGFFYFSATNKQLDEETWSLFKETFKFKYEKQLNDEIYEWLKKIEPSFF